jgi:hypothetical protein
VTFILVFIIVLIISLAYHRKHPPTQAQRYRAKQNRKAAAQVAGIAAVTTCVKLIKEKE